MNSWGKWLRAASLVACLWLAIPVRAVGEMNDARGGRLPAGQETDSQQETEEEILGDLNLDEVQKTVDELLEEEISLTEMIGKLMEGELPLTWETLSAILEKILWDAAGLQKSTCAHILLLVILSSVLANLSRLARLAFIWYICCCSGFC